MGGPVIATTPNRRALGAWYTPDWLVTMALDLVLGGVPAARSGSLRVLDPACGDGRFLAAVLERRPRATVVGVDIDPAAVAAARGSLGPSAHLLHADALAHDWHADQFDLVVGNPPFLNQLAAATSRGGRSALGGGAYADAAALFLALSIRLVRPGGRVVLVLPRSVLATRDAAPIRDAVAGQASLDALWTADHPVFDASVLTVVVSFTKGGRQAPVHRWVGTPPTPVPRAPFPHHPDDVGVHSADSRNGAGHGVRGRSAGTWSALVADLSGAPTDIARHLGGPTLATVATATADFRDQYYGLVGAVGDHDGPRLVTSGAIELGRCSWGERPVRFAGARYERPRVQLARLTPPLATWAKRRMVPKVLVASQTRVLEACVDRDGSWLPSVPVLTVVPTGGFDLDLLGAAICSPVASAWAAAHFAGAGLSSTALKVSARQLLALPLPDLPWDAAVASLAAGDLRRFGETMVGCYDLDDDDRRRVLDWWLPLAERARTRAATDDP